MMFKVVQPYGSSVLLEQFGELQGFEFIDPPIEYRFLREEKPITEWNTPASKFSSLLHPIVIDGQVRTVGLDTRNLVLETRGLAGNFILLLWTRV